jgi:nucleotide-binding universal stress UspA family protein
MSTGNVTVRDDPSKPVVEFRRILVATDFSDGARGALDYALTIARRFKSKVYLAHVIPSQVFHFVSPESSAEAIQKAKVFASGALRRWINSAAMDDVEHEELLVEGQVWPVLQELIESHEIDLLAMGTHGRTSQKKLLLGAVAEEVFRLAECPILSVGPEVRVETGKRAELQRLLYATNLKPHAERAASLAFALERAYQAKLTVLHVVEERGDPSQGGHEIVRDFLVNRLKKVMPAACKNTCEPEFLVRFGEAAQEILRTATEQDADLLVLGLRGNPKVAGQLLSATAYELVRQAPCPVLTLRS